MTDNYLQMTREITEETLHAFRNGDHEAFEKIFVAYFLKIKTFIFGYVKSDSDAEELADNVFITLWENRSKINIAHSLNAYLHTMARNSALNFLKKKYVREEYVNTYTNWQEDVSSEDIMIARELSLLVDMVVEKMPPQRKEIYRLSRVDGLKNEEIANVLGTTKRNVESQISAALKEIRKIAEIFIMLFGI